MVVLSPLSNVSRPNQVIKFYIFLSSPEKQPPERLAYIASIELKRGSRIICHGILRNDHGLLEYMHSRSLLN